MTDDDSLFGDDVQPVDEDSSIDTSGVIDIETDTKGSEMRHAREQYPAPVSWLLETDSDRLIVDWVIEQYLDGDGRAYSKSALEDEIGISRKTIKRRINKFVAIGVLGIDPSSYYDQYYVKDSPVVRALVVLNEAVLDAYPDDPQDIPNL